MAASGRLPPFSPLFMAAPVVGQGPTAASDIVLALPDPCGAANDVSGAAAETADTG